MSEIRFRFLMNIFESKVETNIHSSAQIKSNQIKSNQIKSNQIKSNQIKSNQTRV